MEVSIPEGGSGLIFSSNLDPSSSLKLDIKRYCVTDNQVLYL